MREIYEEERIEAIKRHIEGERSVDIYRSLGKSKPWFMKWWKRYRAGNKEWYKVFQKDLVQYAKRSMGELKQPS